MARDVKRDLRKVSVLKLDAFNPRTAPEEIAVALVTAEAGYFESPLLRLNPGWNRGMTVDLCSTDFKCEATQWAFTAPIKGLADVQVLLLLVYNGTRETELIFENIRTE